LTLAITVPACKGKGFHGNESRKNQKPFENYCLVLFGITLAVAIREKEGYVLVEYERDLLPGNSYTWTLILANHRRQYQMKKQVAMALAVIMVLTSVALALAGPRGASGSRGRGGYTSGNQLFKSKPAQPVTPQAKPAETSGKTGTVQDLGVNPSAKTPADMLKSQSAGAGAAGAGAAAGPQAPPRAAFGGGGGWFGSSWLSWAFLGYLFGRQHQPAAHRPAGEIELVPDTD
jgi:hypothetical protein